MKLHFLHQITHLTMHIFTKVKNGETLQDIARKCNTTVEQLCKLNHISKNAKLKPGQILKYN